MIANDLLRSLAVSDFGMVYIYNIYNKAIKKMDVKKNIDPGAVKKIFRFCGRYRENLCRS